jgi:hypothetical protein
MITTSSIGPFTYNPLQKELFRKQNLWKEWRCQYPDLFDMDDERLAETQAGRGYHFYEWLAAINIFHATGWLSLVEKYQFKNHKTKRHVLQQLDALGLIERVLRVRSRAKAQLPDLLVYNPDYSDWFLCEVKGESDKLRGVQHRYFTRLEQELHKPVIVVRFHRDG